MARARGKPLDYELRDTNGPLDMDIDPPSYNGILPMVEGVLVPLQDKRTDERHFAIISHGNSIVVDPESIELIDG